MLDFSSCDIVVDMEKEMYPFPIEEVDSNCYFLTARNLDGIVKLAQRITLKNGKSYGKIIPIPFITLQSLLKEYLIK